MVTRYDMYESIIDASLDMLDLKYSNILYLEWKEH